MKSREVWDYFNFTVQNIVDFCGQDPTLFMRLCLSLFIRYLSALQVYTYQFQWALLMGKILKGT